MRYNYGKVLRSASCGLDIFVETTKGVYILDVNRKTVVTKDKDLITNFLLRPIGDWPFHDSV